MKQKLGFLLLLFILTQANSQAAIYNKVMLEDPAALCLDGSPGAYYVSQGTEPDKFWLYFQYGGWCGAPTLEQTYENCFYRSKTGLGSSKQYPATFLGTTGFLSNSDSNNFKTWTKVFLKYCDGSGQQGSRAQPLNYRNTKLYFRGMNITLAQFSSLENKFGLFSKSSMVVVSGGSAGGLASFLWTQYVNDNVKSAKVYGVPDSGIFLDQMNYGTKQHTYRLWFQNLFKISNIDIDPPTPQCVKKYPKTRYMCMFAQNIYQEIKAPLFLIESQYDNWSIPFILGISCVTGSTLNSCTSAQRIVIEEYRLKTIELLQKITSNKKNGCWAPACVNHVYNHVFDSPNYRIPMNSSNSIKNTVQNWIENKKVSHRHIDEVKWPSNKLCSGMF